MSKKSKIIGLTGGIGTGKSTVAEYLKSQGYRHIDADEISRSLTCDDSPMVDKLNEIFGPNGIMGLEGNEILKSPGVLNRQALADIVFKDDKRRDKLNEIMLTEIIKIIDENIDYFHDDDCDSDVLLDAPLLFESGLESRCDQVILVVADADERIRRVCQRDGMTEEQVSDRINSQMSDEDKISRSDIVIDNSHGLEELYNQLSKYLLTK